MLADLDAPALERLREHEAAHAARKTVLGAIDRVLAQRR
jgi:hypothetical protein